VRVLPSTCSTFVSYELLSRCVLRATPCTTLRCTIGTCQDILQRRHSVPDKCCSFTYVCNRTQASSCVCAVGVFYSVCGSSSCSVRLSGWLYLTKLCAHVIVRVSQPITLLAQSSAEPRIILLEQLSYIAIGNREHAFNYSSSLWMYVPPQAIPLTRRSFRGKAYPILFSKRYLT
jgi:hypothetical protein